MNHKDRTLEEDLISLLEKCKKSSSISIREILMTLSGKGRLLIVVLLTLPFCQPIPLPGLSTLFGIVIAFVGLRITFGKRIWLPKKILLKNLSAKTIRKITEKSLVMVKKIKKVMHLRLTWLCDHPIMTVINGISIIVLGILLGLPIPLPLTNIPIAWAIIFICLGLLENDGVFVLIGHVIFLLTIMFFAYLIIYPLRSLFCMMPSILP